MAKGTERERKGWWSVCVEERVHWGLFLSEALDPDRILLLLLLNPFAFVASSELTRVAWRGVVYLNYLVLHFIL